MAKDCYCLQHPAGQLGILVLLVFLLGTNLALLLRVTERDSAGVGAWALPCCSGACRCTPVRERAAASACPGMRSAIYKEPLFPRWAWVSATSCCSAPLCRASCHHAFPNHSHVPISTAFFPLLLSPSVFAPSSYSIKYRSPSSPSLSSTGFAGLPCCPAFPPLFLLR